MTKSGVVFFAAVVAVVVVGWFFWPHLPAWPLNAEVTSILLTGIAAAVIAVGALYSQRAIARRQCTFEHLAMLQGDGDLIKGRVEFRKISQDASAMVKLAADETTPEFQAIATHLNEFELIAIGIQRGIIDFELYKRWYRARTIQAWESGEPFINALRKKYKNDAIFVELEIMVKEWFLKSKRPSRSRWWGIFF